MLNSLQSAFKVGELRQKILFTLAMFLVFRIGVFVPVPGVDSSVIADLVSSGALFGFFDTLSGGAFSNFSVFAMSITPYINASIIMQLLTVVIPKLEQLSKEGDEGRKKITQYIRFATVGLAFVQAIGLSVGLKAAVINPNVGSYLMIAVSLTAGTALLMWMGEQITEKGIGNGISLIIFAGIVSGLPGAVRNIYTLVANGSVNIFNILLLVIIAILVIAAVVLIQEGQRRIPVQYAKRVVGRKVYGGQTTHIPLKVNQAGVIPVIFASSMLLFPQTIAGYFQTNSVAQFVLTYFSWGTIAHSIAYFMMIVFFTYFYTAITFNPVDVAENMKKHGGFVHGIRPGRSTAEYLNKVLTRLTLAGAIFLGTIAILPNFIMGTINIPNIYFGGTSLLIVVGVALETMKQIESHLLMRHYQGFLK